MKTTRPLMMLLVSGACWTGPSGLPLFPPHAIAQDSAPRGAASFAEWKKELDRRFVEMGDTVRRRDYLAFCREARDLIERGAEPRDEYRGELRSLLFRAPPGIVLHAVVRALARERHRDALDSLFEALRRTEFRDLAGRSLGEGQVEVRHRVIELYLMRLGDELYEARLQEKPRLDLSKDEEAVLVQELASEDRRRVRCAAYILGGLGRTHTATALIDGVASFEKTRMTQAVLLEAIGRTDPAAGAALLEKAARSRIEQVRLAALPALGHLRGKEPEKLLREALRDRSWSVRSAAVEACRIRRDTFATGLLIDRFSDENPRLQFDILEALLEITGGALPPDPADWKKWWKLAEKGFAPAPRGDKESGVERKTAVFAPQPRYFGTEVWSDRLAIVLDISGSMTSTNLSLGASGVGVEGEAAEGSPLAIAKDQISKLVKRLPTRHGFNIIAYNSDARSLSKKLVPATRKNVQVALQYVNDLAAEGGTNVYGALVAALEDPEVDTVYWLSDGEPTDGLRTEPDDILEALSVRNRFRGTRIHTMQIGDDSELMREVARSTRGTYRHFPVRPGGSAGS